MSADIIIGLVLVALAVGAVYLATHHKPPVTANPKVLSATLAASLQTGWETLKADMPAMISTEVARLSADLAAAVERAEAAEAKLAAELKARQASLAAVKDQIGAVIAGISSTPAEPFSPPAAAGGHAEDAQPVQLAPQA